MSKTNGASHVTLYNIPVHCLCTVDFLEKGKNDLATVNSELLEEWDYPKNTDLDPSQLLPGSGKSTW